MLSDRSCSPAEIQIFWPVRRKLPSSCGSARVRIRPRSVPHCGSVRFIVPDHDPSTIFGRYSAFCASEPCAAIAEIAPWVRPKCIWNAMLAEEKYSPVARPRIAGMPWPPHSSAASIAAQPPARIVS